MELLKKYSIPTPKEKVVKKDEEISFDTFPCVLKINSKTLHKSDIGGVITGIGDNDELKKAKEKIIQNAKKHGVEFDEFLIQEEIEGIELILGSTYDKIFEDVIVFGKGGVLVEIEKDITYIDTESDKEEIEKSIKKTKISKIFPEFRGKKYNLEALIETIQKFQKMIKNENIIECDINPLIINEKGVYAVDFRYKTGQKEKKEFTRKTHSLFENKSVAIFGATDKEEKVGYAIAKNALNSKAKIHFVNPKLNELFGKKVYHSYDELPPVDTCVIATPKHAVLDIVENMAKKGCKNFVIISAGFKESGDIESEKRLSLLAKEYGLNIVGPNCLGIYNGDMELNLTFGKSKIHKGEIGIISQSGAVLTALMDKAAHYEIGFSHIISMGNMADFNFANAIEELNNQKSCKIIAIYAEGIQLGKAFLKAIRNSKKPILLFKAGRSDAAKKAAMSHTGNLAGNYDMIVTLSEIAGAKIKDFMESLIFAPKYDRFEEVIIVTNAGGPGTILTDYVSKYKKIKKLSSELMEKLNEVLPPTWSHNNPIDIIGDATDERYKNVLEIVKDEKAVIFVIVTPQFMTDTAKIAEILKNYDVIPVFLGKDSFEEAEKIMKNRLFFTSLQDSVSVL